MLLVMVTIFKKGGLTTHKVLDLCGRRRASLDPQAMDRSIPKCLNICLINIKKKNKLRYQGCET